MTSAPPEFWRTLMFTLFWCVVMVWLLVVATKGGRGPGGPKYA